jgi:hypothetical protein
MSLLTCNRWCGGNVRYRGVEVERVMVWRCWCCGSSAARQDTHKGNTNVNGKLVDTKRGAKSKLLNFQFSGGFRPDYPGSGRIIRGSGAGLSGFCRIFSCSSSLSSELAPKTSNSWGFRPNQAVGTQIGLDHVQRQVLHGSKPQKTHKIEKSIRSTILGLFFGDFRFYGGNHKSVTNPWQPKAADTIWCGCYPGVGPIFTDSVELVRGFEGEVMNTMNTMNTRRGIGVNRYKHTHTRLPVTPAGPNHPPKSNQTTRKDTKVEFLWRDQIASQLVEWKGWRDQDY